MVNAIENWLSVIWRLFVSPATRALPTFLLVMSDYEYRKLMCKDAYDLSCNHVAVVDTCRARGATDQALTMNDKRSKGKMSTEKRKLG